MAARESLSPAGAARKGRRAARAAPAGLQRSPVHEPAAHAAGYCMPPLCGSATTKGDVLVVTSRQTDPLPAIRSSCPPLAIGDGGEEADANGRYVLCTDRCQNLFRILARNSL